MQNNIYMDKIVLIFVSNILVSLALLQPTSPERNSAGKLLLQFSFGKVSWLYNFSC